jgi:hypothetical protein
MSLSFLIYLVGICDYLKAFFIGLAAVSLISIIILFNHLVFEDEAPAFVSRAKWLIVGFMMSSLLAAFAPSSSTLAAMYLVPKIVENKNIQKIPDNIAKALNAGLDKFINNVTDRKNA